LVDVKVTRLRVWRVQSVSTCYAGNEVLPDSLDKRRSSRTKSEVSRGGVEVEVEVEGW